MQSTARLPAQFQSHPIALLLPLTWVFHTILRLAATVPDADGLLECLLPQGHPLGQHLIHFRIESRRIDRLRLHHSSEFVLRLRRNPPTHLDRAPPVQRDARAKVLSPTWD